MKLTILLLCFPLLLLVQTAVWASMQAAQQYFEAGQHEQAMGEVNKLLKNNPGDPQARFMKGLLLVQQGKDDQAIAVFTQLTADYPELPEPYNNLAVIYAGQGKYSLARDALKAALKTHPSYTTAYVNLGDIYAKLASEAYQQALELDKRDTQRVKVKLELIDKLFPGPAAAQQAASQPIQVPAPNETVKAEPVAQQAKAKSEPKPSSSASDSSADKRQLFKDLKGWAAAWSAQDVQAYLSYYDANFEPSQGSAAEWRQQRHIRLTKPKFIKVKLSDLTVTRLDPDIAEVTLTQRYEADHYNDVTHKRITLARHSDGWKILQETVLF